MTAATSEHVAIVGGREFSDLDAVRQYVNDLPPGTTIITGGAAGVDTVAWQTARDRGLPTPIVIRPDYRSHDKYIAPKVRNWEIVDRAHRVVAFWDGYSGGTAHAIACAVVRCKPVLVIEVME